MKQKIIYLDQKIWVYLAQAHHKTKEWSKYLSAYNYIKSKVESNVILCPLSYVHFIETRKKRNYKKRKELAEVMVYLSKGWSIAPTDYILKQELILSLSKLYGQTKINNVKFIDRGVAFAFGESDALAESLNISNLKSKLLQKVIDNPKILLTFLVGHDESINLKSVNNFYKRAEDFRAKTEALRSKKKNYSKQIRRKSYVAELTYYLQDDIAELLIDFNVTLKDFLEIGAEKLMLFFSSIPTLDIETELVLERDSHWDKKIDINDPSDISFLTVAIPYCDVVITENFWSDISKRKKFEEKYNTRILNNLDEIEKYF